MPLRATRPRWGARLRRPRPAAHTQLCQAREHLEVACRMVGVASQALVEQPTPAGVDVMVDLVRQFNEACTGYQAAAARPGRR